MKQSKDNFLTRFLAEVRQSAVTVMKFNYK